MSGLIEVASGSFTSTGVAVNIPLRSGFDVFEVINQTQAATQQTPGRGVKFEWQAGMGNGTGIEYKKTDATDALNMVWLTSGGFTPYDTSVNTLGAQKALASTYVTQANPAVVTVTSHGYSNGDMVRIYGTTSMLQISGYTFTIAAVSTNTFTLAYLDSSGFASAATAGYVRKVPQLPIYYPYNNRITAITAANPAVVTLAVTHGLTVGQKVRVHCTSDYGMAEINNLIGTISAVSTANNTITLGDIDSSGFTAFAFPTSAAAGTGQGVQPAYICPVGDANGVLDGATDNTANVGITLAAGAQAPAGSNGDVIYWRALTSGYSNP